MALNRQKVDLLNEEVTEKLVPLIGIHELNNVAIDNTTLINDDVISYDNNSGNWVNLCLANILDPIAYTGNWNDLHNTPTTIAGYNITDAYTKTQIDSKIASTFRYKGTVETYSDLPTSGQQVGDVWNIRKADKSHGVKAGDNVCWTGTDWDVLAGTTDLSNYYTKPEIDTKVTDLEDRKANKADISAVGYSGNYSDIISRPTKLSDLTDDTDVNPVKKATVAIAIGFASAGSDINPIYIDNNGIPKHSTATVGSDIKPIYMNSGNITASNANVGTVINPIYIENGEIKASNSNLNLDGNKLLSMVSGSLKESSRTIGDNNLPVYLNAGSINEVNPNLTIKNLLANISTDSSAIVDTDYGFITNNDTTSATAVRKPISKFVDYFRTKLSTNTSGSGNIITDISYNNTNGILTSTKGITFYSGNSSLAEHDCNNMTENGCYYYTTNGPNSAIGASSSDGTVWVQSYNSNWITQIAVDYRNGDIYVRGKNDGSWTSWTAIPKNNKIAPNNLDDCKVSGFYRLNTGHTNQPAGTEWSQMIVSRNSDTTVQIALGYSSNTIWYRGGSDGGDFSSWVKIYPVDYASNAGHANTATLSSTVEGTYTGSGGQHGPNYYGTNRVGFAMMNTPINGDSHYKDFIIMDCYSGDDVGGATAFGVDRQEMKAFIMGSDADRNSWSRSAELITTNNISSQSVNYSNSSNYANNAGYADSAGYARYA